MTVTGRACGSASLGSAAGRLRPRSWDAPEQADWFDALDRQVGADTFVVAHSLGCLAVSAWLANRGRDAAVGAFLVAPPDRSGPDFPPQARSFHPARAALPVPVTVVAPSDAPFVGLEEARTLAQRWGAAFVEAGAVGHVNAANGLGAWDSGRAEPERLPRIVAAGTLGGTRGPRGAG